MYLDPNSLEYELSEEIAAGCSANDLKNAIGSYYSGIYGTNPDVTKACINYFNDTIDCSANPDEIRDHMYTITVPRSISMASTSQIMAVPIDTWASLVVTLPEELQLSN